MKKLCPEITFPEMYTKPYSECVKSFNTSSLTAEKTRTATWMLSAPDSSSSVNQLVRGSHTSRGMLELKEGTYQKQLEHCKLLLLFLGDSCSCKQFVLKDGFRRHTCSFLLPSIAIILQQLEDFCL